MPIVGIVPLNLTRVRGQQMLQRAAVVCNVAPSLPGPDQPGSREGARLTAFLKTQSLPTQVHGQRLRVAGLLS
jgi:hypothetical protein